jgi:hypothetical protein
MQLRKRRRTAEAVTLPRRPALLVPNVPLALVAFTVRRQAEQAGERLERIVIRKTCRQSYNLAIQTRPARPGPLTTRPERKGAEA